jgi:tripartite-type tricarboxylate transporter receptor subunit TctC
MGYLLYLLSLWIAAISEAMMTRYSGFLCMVALLACAPETTAQTYPSRAVRILIPFAAAGGTDILARALSQKMGESLGQPFVVENRAGANSIIATEAVAKAAPDGYTLLFTTNIFTITPWLYRNLAYNAEKDFAPITMAGSAPSLLAVHPSVPARSVKDLVALARSKPGTLTMSAPGVGTPSHLSAEFFKQTTGVDVLIIQYKGTGAALSDLVGGQVAMSFGSLPGLAPLSKAGKLRALAVSSAKRAPAMPEVATIAETFPNFEVVIWYGLFAPARTPRDALARLHGEAIKALSNNEVRTRLAAEGFDTGGTGSEEFTALIRRDMARWQQVITKAKIQVE